MYGKHRDSPNYLDYLHYLKYLNKPRYITSCTNIITESVLGLGTDDLINPAIISAAIKNGYIYFDLADKYNNIELIEQVIKQHDRSCLFINYKLEPPTQSDNIVTFQEKITAAIDKFKYLDCFMFHTIDLFETSYIHPIVKNKFGRIPKDRQEEIRKVYDGTIPFIKKMVEQNKIRSIGVSNVLIDWVFEDLKSTGLKIEYVQNMFNNNLINNFETMETIKYCASNNIKFIGYGTLGGKPTGACGIFKYDESAPLVMFDKITHPRIYSIAEKYNTNIYMLVLAYESKKYKVIQIPTTSKVERVISNFDDFSTAYKKLVEEDLSEIEQELLTVDNKNESIEHDGIIPNKLKRAINYYSRKKLIEHLYVSKSEISMIIDYFLGIYNNEDMKKFIDRICLLYELYLKYGRPNFDDAWHKLYVALSLVSPKKIVALCIRIQKIMLNTLNPECSDTEILEQKVEEIIKLAEFIGRVKKLGKFTIEIVGNGNLQLHVIDMQSMKILTINIPTMSTFATLKNILHTHNMGTTINTFNTVMSDDLNSSVDINGFGDDEFIVRKFLMAEGDIFFMNCTDTELCREIAGYIPSDYPEFWTVSAPTSSY